MIPSTYRPIIALYKDSASYYFNTNIVPTNNTDVDFMFGLNAPLTAYNTFMFGARNTNSNASAGQLNLLFASASYFGYGSTRKSFTVPDSAGQYYYYFSTKANQYTANGSNAEIKTDTATAATFTGTQSMYLMALNNAGTVSHGTAPDIKFFYAKITKGGIVVGEYYPVMNVNTNAVGLYDAKNNSFISASGSTPSGYDSKLTIVSDGGGSAFIRMPSGEYSSISYYYDGTNGPELDFEYSNHTIEAEPNDGYVFSHWENHNGTLISSDRVLHEIPFLPEISGTHNKELHAVFIKKVDSKQNDSFYLMGLQYGVNIVGGFDVNENGMRYDHYTLIRSFEVKEDGLTRTVSTIRCDAVPSTYQVNMPVGIFTSMGEPIWMGKIETINDDVLTCREALSIFDEDFVFVPNASWGGKNLTNYGLPVAIDSYITNFFTLHTSSATTFADTNPCSERKGAAFNSWYEGHLATPSGLDYDNSKNVSITMPLITETNVSNLEEYLMDIFDATGYGIVGKIVRELRGKAVAYLDFYYPNRNEILQLSDNGEFIKNVDIKIESQEATVLEIYNSTGTTCRGVYGMQTDGTITEMVITEDRPLTSFIGYTDCRTAVVLSDDKVETLTVQYLSNSKYNHIITFDLDLQNEMYNISDFTIGRRVQFYYENKVYESVVTGKEYALAENEGSIKSMKVTLGKVRKKLTDRINLSKASMKR